MFTDSQKTDIRRFCGYSVYGLSPSGNMGWRFYTTYGLLEYRLNNLSASESLVVLSYLSTLLKLEGAVPTSSENLDSDAAGPWSHNRDEVSHRLGLFDEWRRRLCGFLGVAPGDGLTRNLLNWTV